MNNWPAYRFNILSIQYIIDSIYYRFNLLSSQSIIDSIYYLFNLLSIQSIILLSFFRSISSQTVQRSALFEYFYGQKRATNRQHLLNTRLLTSFPSKKVIYWSISTLLSLGTVHENKWNYLDTVFSAPYFSLTLFASMKIELSVKRRVWITCRVSLFKRNKDSSCVVILGCSPLLTREKRSYHDRNRWISKRELVRE